MEWKMVLYPIQVRVCCWLALQVPSKDVQDRRIPIELQRRTLLPLGVLSCIKRPSEMYRCVVVSIGGGTGEALAPHFFFRGALGGPNLRGALIIPTILHLHKCI